MGTMGRDDRLGCIVTGLYHAKKFGLYWKQWEQRDLSVV